MRPVDPSRFAEVVRTALHDAAVGVAWDAAVDTRDLLIALMRADAAGEWDRIALHFGDETTLRQARVADPDPEPVRLAGGIRVTGTCAAALATAVDLSDRYDTRVVSVGLAAVALVSSPASAAARALTGGDRTAHADLLRLLQDGVVGSNLGGLDAALRPGGAPDRRGRRRQTVRTVTGYAPDRPSPPDEPDGGSYDLVVAGLGGVERLPAADALELLAVALPLAGDGELGSVYQRMCLGADEIEGIRPHVAGCATRDAATIIDNAGDRFDTARPDARQIVVAATLHPCEQVDRAMFLLGVSSKAVAFEAASADAKAQKVGDLVSDQTAAFTSLDGLLSVVVTVLIVRHVISARDWWPGIPVALLLCLVVWNGNPLGELAATAFLWLWAGPAVAAVALGVTVAGVLLTRAEVQNALHRTGISMSIVQWRRHLRLRYPRQSPPATRMILIRRSWRAANAEEPG